jgi:hypothetical protein
VAPGRPGDLAGGGFRPVFAGKHPRGPRLTCLGRIAAAAEPEKAAPGAHGGATLPSPSRRRLPDDGAVRRAGDNLVGLQEG